MRDAPRLVPKPFQADAVDALMQGHHGLFWKPGVGKTLPLVLAGERTGDRQLWVTLASLREQAASVIAAQRTDRPKVQVIRSLRETPDPRADVIVVSYDMMRDAGMWRALFALRYGSIVADEAQALRNTGSVRTRAFYGARPESPGALWRRAPAVWLATGTPLMKDPTDLWPHVSRLWPGMLPDPRTKQGWIDRYCVVRTTAWGQQVIGTRNEGELRGTIQRMGSVRELELEHRLDIDTIKVEISPEMRRIIAGSVTPQQWAEIETLFTMMDGGAGKSALQAQAGLLPIVTARRVLGLAKAKPVLSLALDELGGGLEQMVIWGHHTEALHAIHEGLRAAKIRSSLVTGETPASTRQGEVARFSGGQTRVLVCNIIAAGSGLDGMQCAHRAIFAEASWLPAENSQAIARLYRTGQQYPVHATFVAVRNSPDERITRVLEQRARSIAAATGAAA